jgi:hypothetical protein
MFRSERLDFTRPALRSAAEAALDMLAGTGGRDEPMRATLTLPQAAQMVVAWSLVHGFAMLLFDDGYAHITSAEKASSVPGRMQTAVVESSGAANPHVPGCKNDA